MSLPRWPLALLVVACGEPAPSDVDDTETDAETDTDPPDLDASGWEIHPSAPQVYVATAQIGEQEVVGDFVAQGEPLHSIVPYQGVDYRNFIGSVIRDNPLTATPPQVELEMRVIVPEDEQVEGNQSCKGTEDYGVAVSFFSRNGEDRLPLKVFTSTRLDPEGEDACAINIETHTFQRFTATIKRAVLKDQPDDEGVQRQVVITNATIDLVLREIAE